MTGANRHDSVKLEELLYKKVRKAPLGQIQNLCLDAGYVGKAEIAKAAGYVPHIRPRGEEKQKKQKDPSFKPRRWVVELTHSWFNRFRKINVRYEKTERSYLGLLKLAASMIILNKVTTIYG